MNRLEEHIKNKLQNREITPSSEAWSKISEELKIDKKPASKNKYWWAIAAGFAGIILIATLFFKNQASVEKIGNTEVAEEEVHNVDSEENQNSVQVNEVGLTTSENELVIDALPDVDKVKKEGLFNEPQKKEQWVQNHHATDNPLLKEEDGVSEWAISDKLEEVMKQVKTMENNAIVVTDAEIDSLLLTAQHELLTQKAVQESGKVDAMALLGEVEFELYDDQRNQLFITLKEGFFKLRTAVADRNN